MRNAGQIILSDAEVKTLKRWSRGRSIATRLVLRAKIVLSAARGMRNKDIAMEIGTDAHTVGCWRSRFARLGLKGLEKDAPRGGRKPTVRQHIAARIIEKTTQEKPANATHWSTRTLARELRTSHSMIHRVWQANGLKPHLIRTFKISNDPQFTEKLIDIVGLYLDPPEHAMVLCADEKSSIQALDRTQPGLPLKKGRCGTMTRDYKRNGTTTLFAALNVAEGRLIGTCMPKHRHQEWIKFLQIIDQKTPKEFDWHMIVDNYAAHKHPKVKTWLKRHKRFHMHFTPTSSSWLNLVERWFRELTDKQIRRGTFRNVPELTKTIMDYIDAHNKNPKSFAWTAKAENILDKVKRARAALDNVSSA